jgi:F-type H+-transporting ATPase subunit alpha
MAADKHFQELVDAGNAVGEIIGVDRFLIRVRGLQPINVHALIMFEDGSKGYVHHVFEDYVIVLHLGNESLRVGMVAVVQHPKLVTKVGKNFIGRVVNIFGEPLDGKGPITPDATWTVFNAAPMLYERELLDSQVETGVTALDIMFSLLRGQRMAVLGDSKSGKTTLTTQIAINQRSTDITVIYVLVAKRHTDVAQLLDRLEKNDALDKAIIVVATMFESLIVNYLAPYVGAAMGEYLWQKCDMDTLVIYDDLTSHGMAYREISLIAGVSPGRDSYPGDIFYIHSQLVERAGKTEINHASQTILPIVYAPNGDITAYLPTNVMSMTDGQWILDMAVFRDTMRPAISTGLSVTRVGGVGQNKRQKGIASKIYKTLASYRQAEEYARFGSELSPESAAALDLGKQLYILFNQVVGETYSLMSQQLLLDVLLNQKPGEKVDIPGMKAAVAEYAARIQEDVKTLEGNFDAIRDEFKAKFLLEKATEEAPKEEIKTADTPVVPDGADKKSDDKDKDKKDDKKEAAPAAPAAEPAKDTTPAATPALKQDEADAAKLVGDKTATPNPAEPPKEAKAEEPKK